MVIHLLRHIDNPKTMCGKDTIKVAESGERLALVKKNVTCPECLKKL